VAMERSARLKSGHDLLASLSAQQLHALTGYSQWTRIYRPSENAGAPATEVGYSLVEVVAGKRGELNPGRNPSKFSPAERKEGLIVRVQGRVLADAKRRLFYDSLATYWMAWDQSEEAWSVRTTQRQGEAEKSEAETGLRAAPTVGSPQAVLQVIKSSEAAEPVSNQWEVPDVYLSQALGWIIGRILPRDLTAGATGPTDYAWYFYVSSNRQPKVYQRLDRWEGRNDGTYTLTTYLTPDTPPFVSTYAADGSFVRRVHSDGTITEPISLEDLRKLWKSKGLPVGASDR